MKITVFRYVALCSLVEVYRRFRDAYCIVLPMDVVSTCETSVNFYQTTQCSADGGSITYETSENIYQPARLSILEGSPCHSSRPDNVNSHRGHCVLLWPFPLSVIKFGFILTATVYLNVQYMGRNVFSIIITLLLTIYLSLFMPFGTFESMQDSIAYQSLMLISDFSVAMTL
jgi:hypothetical protein